MVTGSNILYYGSFNYPLNKADRGVTATVYGQSVSSIITGGIPIK